MLSNYQDLDKKTKINIVISVLIVIASIIAVIVIIKNKTKQVATVEEVKNAEVIDVSEKNIKIEYDESKTSDNVELKVKEYDDSYNLFYYIQEVGESFSEDGQVPQTDENKEVNNEIENLQIDNTKYKKYDGNSIPIETNSILDFKYENDGEYSKNAYKIKITNITDEGEKGEGASIDELKQANISEQEISKNTEPYYIKINKSKNYLSIYKKDESGKYTVPIKTMICSTGTVTPTSGIYKTQNKYIWKKLRGGVWGQYSTRIVGNILISSVPYNKPTHDTLSYETYDKLGSKASEGCIYLTTSDAKWIYNNCELGTLVEFYSNLKDEPNEELTAQKITNITEYRDWDPTDPVQGNPWKNWNGQEDQPEQTTQTEKNEKTENSEKNDKTTKSNKTESTDKSSKTSKSSKTTKQDETDTTIDSSPSTENNESSSQENNNKSSSSESSNEESSNNNESNNNTETEKTQNNTTGEE